MGKQAWEHVWGPLLYGKFRDQADDISMSWLWAKLRNRRQVTGEEAKGELLVYPQGSFESIFVRLRELIEEHGGRVLIDRPAARLARDADGRFLVTPAAPDSFRRGLDPREFETAGEPERYDAVIAALPSDIFEQLLDPELRGRDRRRSTSSGTRSIEYFAALCLLCEIDRQFHPFYWTNVADTEPRLHRPDRADEPGPARALRRPPLPLRRQLPAPRPRAARARHGRADRLLRARAAQGQPRLQPRVDQAELAVPRARRPARRAARTTATGCRRTRPASRACCSRTRPRSIPTTAAPTTPCARPRRSSRSCSASRRSSGRRPARRSPPDRAQPQIRMSPLGGGSSPRPSKRSTRSR